MSAAEPLIPTLVALLTPPGRGALATIALRGPEAYRFAQGCLATAVPAAERTERPWLRQFQAGAGAGEELVVAFPNGDEARLHCHGGAAACEAVLNALERQGAVRVGWQQWNEAVADNAIASSARIALAGALTERTACILLDQLHGALANELQAICDLLMQSQNVIAATDRLDELLARASLGLHLTQPWRVVIAGRPNAGKSSLLNALLGFQRAIISEIAGTTRDVVTARTAFAGWPVELLDTAGLRESTDPVELAGVALARQEIAGADLLLHVVPANEPLPGKLSANAGLLVRTKCDLLPTADAREPIDGLLVSVVTGAGLKELGTAIAAHLVPRAAEPQTAVPFTAGQVADLKQCRAAIASDPARGRQILQSMLIERGTN
ncbi:tRNA modification GTPase MnmE [Anatilimnocola aggregata]|uniref:tRNA modification GTPase MnmE n=1 Tax=Anatilimnocola aggregata TaxID=2528021 RepID=A0A517YDE4_9BACT|nr:GTPase [Anatilimnocola aggregata]QDU28260.1 tRNA modification GTPase MnmE [Anatilimnocola aggregata]